MWHQYHTRERFERLPQAKVLRCKECAQHTTSDHEEGMYA